MTISTGVEAPTNEAEAKKPQSWESPIVKIIVWATTSFFCILVWIALGRVVFTLVRHHL